MSTYLLEKLKNLPWYQKLGILICLITIVIVIMVIIFRSKEGYGSDKNKIIWNEESYNKLKNKIISSTKDTTVNTPVLLSCIANNFAKKSSDPAFYDNDKRFKTELDKLIKNCKRGSLSDPGRPKCKKSCDNVKCDNDDGCGNKCGCPGDMLCDNGKCQPLPDHWTQTTYNKVAETFFAGFNDVKNGPTEDQKKCIINNFVKQYKSPREINNKSFDNLSDLMYKCITSELSDPGPPKELSHDLDEIPDHWTPDMYKRVVDSFSEYAKQMNDPLVTDTKIKCIINNYIKAYKNPRDVDPNAQTKLDQIKNDCVNSILSDPGPPVF